MEQSILELAFNYYRSPSDYPELVDVETLLPSGVDFLLDLVAGNIELNTDELQGELKGVPANDLKAASGFYIERVFFSSNANFYRILGLNADATQEQIRHHYDLLIHILCLDQEDKAAQWDDVYAMQINQAYSVLRIPEKRKKYNERHNIVVSGFSGVEKQGESRRVLDRGSETNSENLKNSSGTSFVAANIDLAYLSKEDDKVVEEKAEVEVPADNIAPVIPAVDRLAATKEIDSASPENLYEPYETETVSGEGPVITDTEPTVFSEQDETKNVEKPLSRTGMYSLFGTLLLVSMGGAVIYFSESFKSETDVPHETGAIISEAEGVGEPENGVELLENGADKDIVTIVDDKGAGVVQDEKVKPEPEKISSEVKEKEKVKEKTKVDVVVTEPPKNIMELPLASSEPLTKNTKKEAINEPAPTPKPEPVVIPDVVTAAEPEIDTVISDSKTEVNVASDDVSPVKKENTDKKDNTEKVSAVVRNFVHYYNVGDLGQFISLFAKDAKTDDRDSISGIRDDYADAFNLTVKRKFLIDDVQWVMLDEKRSSGTANFVLFVQALGESRFTEYTGEITFDMEIRDNVPLITGLYYQYNE